MKLLCLLLLILGQLHAQGAGTTIIDFGGDVIDNKYAGVTLNLAVAPYLLSNIKYSWQISDVGGTKEFKFYATSCVYADAQYGTYTNFDGDITFYLAVTPLLTPVCTPLAESEAETIGAIGAAMMEFLAVSTGVPHLPPIYGPYARTAHPDLTLVPPATSADPQMIMLDGLSYNILRVDMTTFAISSLVALPPQARVFAVRPSSTGVGNEVWTAHAETVNEISICDLDSQSVLATIPTSTLDPNNTAPAGIAFTNSGGIALYAVSYYTKDSAGNLGVLLAFDAVTQTLTSTLLLKYAPTALVMSPDGLTAYLLSSSGMITYYDVLSGTADLSASTYTPGKSGGYPGLGTQIFIHPDGTRLFWKVGNQLQVFDLTVRQITSQFNSGLPSTDASSIEMSQDGSTVWFAGSSGDVVILDTRYGNILATYQPSPDTAVYPGPAY